MQLLSKSLDEDILKNDSLLWKALCINEWKIYLPPSISSSSKDSCLKLQKILNEYQIISKQENYEDEEIRIHLKGNEKVGKTSLIKYWKEIEYNEYEPTDSFTLRYLSILNQQKSYKIKVV